MPSTITGFTAFVFDTLIDEEAMNENFSSLRGNLIPIEELTATSSDNSHDLGIASHRWRDLHLGRDINMVGDINLTATGYVYFGDKTVDGNWRVGKSGVNLAIQVRVAGVWTDSGEFTVP